jgi:hypothetical protein
MTVLRDAYVGDTEAIVAPWFYDNTVPVPVIPGYAHHNDTVRFVYSHRAPEHRAWSWLAGKADLFCAIAITVVLIVVPGVLPIFI